MAQVPQKESEFMTLASEVFQGFNSHLETFPDVPVGATEFGPLLSQYNAQKEAIANAKQAMKEPTAEKNRLLDQLRLDLSRNLRYAERVTKNDPTKLEFIHWGPRKEPEPIALPGMPSSLAATSQGRGWVELEWGKTTVPGCGAPTFYVVQRQFGPDIDTMNWQNLRTTQDLAVRLDNQPTDVTIQYQVIARNASGVSLPSKIVQVVL